MSRNTAKRSVQRRCRELSTGKCRVRRVLSGTAKSAQVDQPPLIQLWTASTFCSGSLVALLPGLAGAGWAEVAAHQRQLRGVRATGEGREGREGWSLGVTLGGLEGSRGDGAEHKHCRGRPHLLLQRAYQQLITESLN